MASSQRSGEVREYSSVTLKNLKRMWVLDEVVFFLW